MRASNHGLFLLALAVATVPGCSGGSDGGVVTPPTLEVGLDGSADYASLQEAVNAATAGTTILVQPGLYTERVDISKTLTIRGSGPGTVIEYPADGPPDSAVITIRDVSGVSLTDLSVRAEQIDVDGIRVRDAAAVVLDSIVASNNRQDGVDVRRSSGIDISSCTAENNGGDGVQIDEQSEDVAVVDSRAASNQVDGIKISLSSYVLVQNNVSTLNSDDGILVRDSNNVQVIANSSTNNLDWGVSVTDSPDTLLQGNTVEQNGGGDVKCEPVPCSTW